MLTMTASPSGAGREGGRSGCAWRSNLAKKSGSALGGGGSPQSQKLLWTEGKEYGLAARKVELLPWKAPALRFAFLCPFSGLAT